MSKDTKFKPGQSGNPPTRFKPGNQHRWQPRQSGNPAGIARSRLQFEENFYAALLARGSAGEVASLLWSQSRTAAHIVSRRRGRILWTKGLSVGDGDYWLQRHPEPGLRCASP